MEEKINHSSTLPIFSKMLRWNLSKCLWFLPKFTIFWDKFTFDIQEDDFVTCKNREKQMFARSKVPTSTQAPAATTLAITVIHYISIISSSSVLKILFVSFYNPYC